ILQNLTGLPLPANSEAISLADVGQECPTYFDSLHNGVFLAVTSKSHIKERRITLMPKIIQQPTRIQAAGNMPKLIDEVFGRVNSGDAQVSIAHMRSPSGWVEPGQRPAFDEYTYVLRGELRVEIETADPITITAGQAIHTAPGEWVRYSTPGAEGCEYIAVCLPAFSPDTVN